MNNECYVEITTTEDPDLGVTVSYVGIHLDDLFVEAAGSAKCMEEDSFDGILGEKLALGRALQKVGKLLEKDSFAEVHRRDRIRVQQLDATENLRKRSAEARYKWECEFAQLIELELQKQASLRENDVVPEPLLKAKKKARKKAHQIRENLPA